MYELVFAVEQTRLILYFDGSSFPMFSIAVRHVNYLYENPILIESVQVNDVKDYVTGQNKARRTYVSRYLIKTQH
jgi:hypothetical protein